MKDPRLAAVAQILEKKKISEDKSHVPVIMGVSQTPQSLTEEKLLPSKPRVVNLGNSATPLKAAAGKVMTVKLKASQVQFKSSEVKVVKKE